MLLNAQNIWLKWLILIWPQSEKLVHVRILDTLEYEYDAKLIYLIFKRIFQTIENMNFI